VCGLIILPLAATSNEEAKKRTEILRRVETETSKELRDHLPEVIPRATEFL
jgi:hypothetical protein